MLGIADASICCKNNTEHFIQNNEKKPEME